MENQNDDQKNAVNQIYEYAANLMVKEGKSTDETKNALIESGLDGEIATIIVTNLEEQIKDAKNRRGKKNMIHGALWCIGGIIVTAITYSVASGGGTYVIAWGAILFGAIQFIKGLTNSSS